MPNESFPQLNPFFHTADPLKYSYSCGFEVQNACGYVQDEDDDIDWYLTHLDLTDPDALGYNPTSLQTDNSYGEVGRGKCFLSVFCCMHRNLL